MGGITHNLLVVTRLQSVFCAQGMSFSSAAPARERYKIANWIMRYFIFKMMFFYSLCFILDFSIGISVQ